MGTFLDDNDNVVITYWEDAKLFYNDYPDDTGQSPVIDGV